MSTSFNFELSIVAINRLIYTALPLLLAKKQLQGLGVYLILLHALFII